MRIEMRKKFLLKDKKLRAYAINSARSRAYLNPLTRRCTWVACPTAARDHSTL